MKKKKSFKPLKHTFYDLVKVNITISGRHLYFALEGGQKSAESGTRMQWVGKDYRRLSNRVMGIGPWSVRCGFKR